MTVRRIGSGDPIEVLSGDEFARRKEEAEWQRHRRPHGLDIQDEHARLALQPGDVVIVSQYTGDVWWFVRDVDGIARVVTAGTFLFDQPRERTFPFELVEPFRLWHIHEQNEAALCFARLQARLGRVRRPEQRAA